MLRTSALVCLIGSAVAVPVHLNREAGGLNQPRPTPVPLVGPTYWEVIGNNSDYSTFRAMVTSNKDIMSQFVEGNNYKPFTSRVSYYGQQTFLIPNNKAFDALGDYKKIAANTELFTSVINFHLFSRTGQSITSRDLKAGNTYLTQQNSEFLTVSQARVSPTGWQFSPASEPDAGQKMVVANVVKADIKAAEGIMHEIDQVLIPPTPQPQGTICVQKDHPDSSFHCPIMDMAMGMEVRDGAALTEDEEEQQEEEEETPYDESPEERRERRQWGPGGYGYGGGGGPSPFTCEAGYIEAPRCGGWMRPGGSGLCVKEGCAISKLATWDGRGNCCSEGSFCKYRADSGTGAECEVKRPMPITTTSMPPVVCPADCKPTFTDCVKKYMVGSKKSDAEERCLAAAENGYLCKGKCDAAAFLGDNVRCPDIQVFQSCGGCQPTCDNRNPRCDKMCHQDCFCPNGMLWDDAEEKCLAADGSECPDVGTCEPQVHGNEEGAGGLPVECHGFELGNVCAAPGCLKGCVPTADKGELFDRYVPFCTKVGTDSTGKSNPTQCAQSKDCEWAAGSGEPPTYMCTEDSWIVSDEGSCDSGAGVAISMCDYFEQTQCLNKECSTQGDEYTKCTSIVDDALSQCKVGCMFTHGNPDAEARCAACLDEAMMSTFDINEDQSDLVSCCNCITTALQAKGMSDAQMNDMFETACPTPSPLEDDDVDDDY